MCLVYSITQEKFPTGNLFIKCRFLHVHGSLGKKLTVEMNKLKLTLL